MNRRKITIPVIPNERLTLDIAPQVFDRACQRGFDYGLAQMTTKAVWHGNPVRAKVTIQRHNDDLIVDADIVGTYTPGVRILIPATVLTREELLSWLDHWYGLRPKDGWQRWIDGHEVFYPLDVLEVLSTWACEEVYA